MKYVPFILMLLGGCLLLVPGGDTDVAFSDTLSQAYKADRLSKIAALKQVSRMDSDPQAKSKAFSELDRTEFLKNFEAWGKTVSAAIQDGKEVELVDILEN